LLQCFASCKAGSLAGSTAAIACNRVAASGAGGGLCREQAARVVKKTNIKIGKQVRCDRLRENEEITAPPRERQSSRPIPRR
jgi:hypothetical protein